MFRTPPAPVQKRASAYLEAHKPGKWPNLKVNKVWRAERFSCPVEFSLSPWKVLVQSLLGSLVSFFKDDKNVWYVCIFQNKSIKSFILVAMMPSPAEVLAPRPMSSVFVLIWMNLQVSPPTPTWNVADFKWYKRLSNMSNARRCAGVDCKKSKLTSLTESCTKQLFCSPR